MPPMLLLLQDISSPFGVAPLLFGPRASVSAITLRSGRTAPARALGPARHLRAYQSGEAPVPEPPFVVTTHLPDAIEDFVRLVIPELQRRGLFHRFTASRGPHLARKPRPSARLSRAGASSRRGVFAVSPAVSATGRQRIAHRRTALFPGAGNQTVPGEFFLRSFDGNARASGEAGSPDPRRSQDPRGKHP